MIYKERERTAAVEGEGAYSGKSSQGSSFLNMALLLLPLYDRHTVFANGSLYLWLF